MEKAAIDRNTSAKATDLDENSVNIFSALLHSSFESSSRYFDMKSGTFPVIQLLNTTDIKKIVQTMK